MARNFVIRRTGTKDFIRASCIFFYVVLVVNGQETTPHLEARPSKPNIVFIMADDLGFNDVGYHNQGEDIYTPTIDRLARQGVILENYYVQPVCTPTRSQFMSGRSQIHTGLQHKIIQRNQPNALPDDSPTLADKMKEAGYSTDMVGKWHLGFYKNRYLPTRRGFDTFYGMYLGSGDYFSHRACMSGGCYLDLHNDTTSGTQPDFNQESVYSTTLFTDEAVRVIGHRAREDNPFFLFLSYQAVHGPLQVPPRYKHAIRQRFGWRAHSSKRLKFAAMNLAMDEGIERVVTALEENGVWNNTIIVFSSDNGGKPKLGSSNYPLRGYKGTYYEGGVRAVGFVSSPLLRYPGYINSELMHVTDWFPTFVSLANGTLNGTRDVNGFDQWDSINEGLISQRDEILYNIDPWTRSRASQVYRHTFDTRILASLRKGNYKIITGLDTAPGFSLFDVWHDPNEYDDLANLTNYRAVADQMLDRLQVHYETSVPVRYPRSDNVRNYFDDYWRPWRGE